MAKLPQRVLITGARGQLARAIAQAAPVEVECIGVARAELDIADENAVRATLDQHKPDCIINGAAYNLVDKAEGEGKADSLRVNALGPACLSAAARDAGIPLVHFSTDYVFDGKKRSPYTEDDATRPLGVYAASKLAGENIVLAASPRNFAIRVCRLFGPVEQSTNGSGSQRKPVGNFPLLMLHLARERGEVRVVNDQIGTPTYTPDLARAVWQLLGSSESGLFQLSNEGEVAFDDYAREIFRLSDVDCEVHSITSAEYAAAANRPLYSTMSNRKAYNSGVAPLRSWQEALQEFLGSN